MEVPQEIKNRTTMLLSNFTTGYLAEENENTDQKGLSAPPHSTEAIAKIQKQPTCPSMDEWIEKIYIYTHTEIAFSLKKEILSVTTSLTLRVLC